MTSNGLAATGGRAARRDESRHRHGDWIVAVVCYPLTLLLTLMPGGLEETGGELARSQTPSLVFRHFPGLLAEAPDGIWAALDHWAMGLLVFVCVPGLTAWAALYRRSRPELLLGLATLWLLLFANIAPIALALYSYAAWFTVRGCLAAWCAGAPVAFAVGLWDTAALGWSAAAACLVAVVTPVSLGLWTGTRRQLVASLQDRAEHLERAQRLLAERATAAERTRIAREMHDVVAHRVSLMVLQAGGLEISATDPAVATAAGHIRSTGREALSELRGVLGVLREEGESDAPTAPQPVLGDLDELIAGWRAAGMTVRFQRTGTVRPLPSPLERTAYRVVQEALTNAGKHAPDSAARVHLRYQPPGLTVDVVTDTPRRGAATDAGGYGLTGLRERLALIGGELTAGPRPGGTWRVRATLPSDTAPEAGNPDGDPPPSEEPFW